MAEEHDRNARPGNGREETGKDRAARLRLDYHARRDGLAWGKSVLTWTALVASVAWVLFGLRPGDAVPGVTAVEPGPVLLTENGRQRVNHGPVAGVHAAWETDCDACHDPFVPINPDSVAAGWIGDHVGTVTRKCSACHAGPAHHPNQKDALMQSCTGCHRDHRGRDFDLNAVTDTACVRCHADLDAHRVERKPGDADRTDGWDHVTAFARAAADVDGGAAQPHPPFRVDTPDGAGDPGRLKFNHDLHLTPGLKGGGVDFYRYADIPAADAIPRYLDQAPALSGGTRPSAGDLVELDCTACHETAVTGPTGEVELAGDQRYFLPVNYERHCAACHPVDLPGFAAPDLPAEIADAPIDVPHGLGVRETDEAVRAAIAGRLLEYGLPGLADAEFDRLTAGSDGEAADGDETNADSALSDAAAAIFARSAGVFPARKEQAIRRELRESPDDAEVLRKDLAAKLPDRLFGAAANRQMLFGEEQTCAKCHFFTTSDAPLAANEKGSEFAPDADDLTGPAFAALRIAPPNIPDVWYQRGVFDHRPHRATGCATCHPSGDNPRAKAAVGTDPALGVRQGDWAKFTAAEMLIPGIDNCRACHAPESEDPETGLHTGGVRYGCTVCHLYHAADRRAGGIATDRWRNHRSRFNSAEEFLNPTREAVEESRSPATGGTRDEGRALRETKRDGDAFSMIRRSTQPSSLVPRPGAGVPAADPARPPSVFAASPPPGVTP